MTVTVTTSRVSYAGNGSTTAFAAPFYFLASADLVVISTVVATNVSTTLALSTNYTVTGAGVASGGTVTCLVAPAVGTTLVIYRSPAITQSVDYQPNDPFPAQTHETALDRLTMIAQRQSELSSRSFRLNDGDVTGVSTILPIPTASNFIGWNSAATGLQNYTPASVAVLVASSTALADTFTGNGSTTAFTLSASPGALANLDVSVGGVVQIPTLNYTWASGTTLTFATAPPNLAKVLVRYQQGLAQGTTDSAASLYLPAGTGAVTTNVQAKLRESVSVKDFGAVGDGTTDDTAAFTAALATLKEVFVPAGTYGVTGVVFNNGSRLRGEGTWSAVQQTDEATATTVLRYIGAGGANSFVVRMSKTAVGTDPGTLSSANRSLLNCSITNLVIDGNDLAEYGLYMARAWSNNKIESIAVTGTVQHAFWAALCWNGSPRDWFAYKNKGCGITLGANTFVWASATVDQSTCINFIGSYSGYSQALVAQNVFNETTNQAKEYGIGVFGCRSVVLIEAQSYQNGGAGHYVSTTLSPVLFLGGYNEANGKSTNNVSTKSWDIWVNSTVSSWNVTFDHIHLGLTPAVRLTGSAPSRNQFGVLFNRMALLTEINADWSNFRLVDCSESVTYSGVALAPASAEYTPSGIKFNYNHAALAYYDESTFTPALVMSNADQNYTYNAGSTVAAYTRIGRQVFVYGRIVLTAITAAGTGSLRLSNLPFTANASFTPASATFSRVLNLTTAVVSMTGSVQGAATYINLYKRTAAAVSETAMAGTDLSATTDFAFAASYFV